MKRLLPGILLCALLSLVTLLLTAQTDTVHTGIPVAGATKPISLAAAGINAAMLAPEGAVVKNMGGFVVTDDLGFAIRLAPVSADTFSLAAIRSSAEENEVNKLKRYIVNTDSVLYYEVLALGERIEYHLHAVKTINGTRYHFYNDRGLGRYSQERADVMYEAIKSVR